VSDRRERRHERNGRSREWYAEQYMDQMSHLGVKVPRVVRANRDLIVKIYANHGPFNNYAITWGTQWWNSGHWGHLIFFWPLKGYKCEIPRPIEGHLTIIWSLGVLFAKNPIT
jgi:hypothetical protein